METLTYEAVRRNPDLLDKLLQDARRERSEAVHRRISAAFGAPSSRPRQSAAGPALQTSACGNGLASYAK